MNVFSSKAATADLEKLKFFHGLSLCLWFGLVLLKSNDSIHPTLLESTK